MDYIDRLDLATVTGGTAGRTRTHRSSAIDPPPSFDKPPPAHQRMSPGGLAYLGAILDSKS
jgi:hypothetical protein